MTTEQSTSSFKKVLALFLPILLASCLPLVLLLDINTGVLFGAAIGIIVGIIALAMLSDGLEKKYETKDLSFMGLLTSIFVGGGSLALMFGAMQTWPKESRMFMLTFPITVLVMSFFGWVLLKVSRS